MSDRDALIDAIRSTPNLGAAAKRLGIARKTLYNRMRELGLPRGRSGRPKRRLTKRKHAWGYAAAAAAAALAGAAIFRGRGGRSS